MKNRPDRNTLHKWPLAGAWLILLSLTVPRPGDAGQEQLNGAAIAWQLQRDRDGVQVFTGDVTDSQYDAVKTTTVVRDVALNTLAAILRDKAACEEWVNRCEEARVVERISEREWIAYTRTDLPFPFNDRWLLSRSLWSQNPDTYEVTVRSEAIQRDFAENVSGVRVTDSRTAWWLTPTDANGIRITNVTHVEPEVPLPSWITNRLLVQGPFRTMQNLVSLSRDSEYVGQSVGFVEEPAPVREER